eukprot:COSAG04_NODE_399_length_14959_cov_28.238730_10_plen_241_part_00
MEPEPEPDVEVEGGPDMDLARVRALTDPAAQPQAHPLYPPGAQQQPAPRPLPDDVVRGMSNPLPAGVERLPTGAEPEPAAAGGWGVDWNPDNVLDLPKLLGGKDCCFCLESFTIDHAIHFCGSCKMPGHAKCWAKHLHSGGGTQTEPDRPGGPGEYATGYGDRDGIHANATCPQCHAPVPEEGSTLEALDEESPHPAEQVGSDMRAEMEKLTVELSKMAQHQRSMTMAHQKEKQQLPGGE